jgi:GT2 family glycosyltransferase
MVSVIIPSYERYDSLLACVKSIKESRELPEGGIEIVIVTSGYSDPELEALRGSGCRVVALDDPVCTSDSRNIGAASSSGDYLLFLDDDNVVGANSISLLSQSLVEWPDAAMVGPAMYYGADPNRLWCAGVHRSRVLMKTTFNRQLPKPLPPRIASEGLPNCFMVRRSDFNVVNGFDAVRFPQQWEESDLANRLTRSTGGSVYVIPSARIWHNIETQLARRLHLRNAQRAYLCARGRAMFTATHGDWLQWVAYLLAAQWMFAGLYLGAAFWLPSRQRNDVVGGYVRGLRVGLLDGWRARTESGTGTLAKTSQPTQR